MIDCLLVVSILFFLSAEVLDADEVETAAARELEARELETESAVWEIAGKLACLAHAFGGDVCEEKESNEAAMMEQVKRLQEEAAARALAEI